MVIIEKEKENKQKIKLFFKILCMKSITRSNVNYANINITCQCILRNATYNISVTNKYFHEREKVLQQTTLSATKKQKLKHKN